MEVTSKRFLLHQTYQQLTAAFYSGGYGLQNVCWWVRVTAVGVWDEMYKIKLLHVDNTYST